MKSSAATKILKEFLKPQFRYKGVPVNFLGIPALGKSKERTNLSKEIFRLKQKGIIEKEGEFLRITPRGREYIKKIQDSLTLFPPQFSESSPKNLLLIFDIPERKKAEREWFRFHLKKFNYILIQKSVWVGPSPLPADFMDYLKEIKLRDCIKTFKLAGEYKEKK